MTPTLLLTRPMAASTRFLAQVEEAMGGPVTAVLSPLIRIEPLERTWDDPTVTGVILTSEHGAEAAGRMGFPPGLTAYAVGSHTAEAAQAAGLSPVSADGDADALIAMILERGEKGPLLHLRGENSRGDIAPRLSEAGVPCGETKVYLQHEAWLSDEARDLLAGSGPVVLPLFSPRSVTILAGQGPFNAALHVIAMSDAVESQLKRLRPTSMTKADRPDARAMVKATVNRLQTLGHGPAA